MLTRRPWQTWSSSSGATPQAVRNMREFTSCGWTDIVRMTAYNPAVELGLTDSKGVIRRGADADLVIYDEDADLKHTIIGGEVYV